MDAKDFDLLYRSLDGPLSEEEERRLRLLLAVSPQAREERRRLQALRTALATRSLRAFEPGFADRVMAAVGAEAPAKARTPAETPTLPPPPSMLDRLGWWLQAHGWSWRVAGWATAVTTLVVALGLAWWLHPTVVSVPYGQTAAVTLPDGSNVELASGTTLTYRWRWGQEARRVSLEGEAFFDVVPDARPFVVEAFNATVRVTGTRFNVAAWPDDPQRQTVVTVEEGRVEVAARPPAGAEAAEQAPAAPSLRPEAQTLPAERLMVVAPVVVLEAGQGTRVVGDSLAPRPPQAVAVEAALAWRAGALWFRDQPLAVIFRQLERRYATPIRAVSPEVAARRHTYQNPAPVSVASVLSDICLALDLRYRRTAQGYEVFSP
ncbi:hypothetical protein AWN76_017040 [Rhodothermaceae bacterium RA]|nr:hypothetical protein AWN76_017040 [Rhodothermaceae bacterium RA]